METFVRVSGRRKGDHMKRMLVVFLSVFLMLCVVHGKNELQSAERYPSKPITFVVPMEAGGGVDVAMRPFCEKLGVLLGEPVIIVNKPGAGSSIGYRAVHDAKPDGYTMGVAMVTLVSNKLQGILPYDHHEFTILGANQRSVLTIVAATRGKRNFKTLQEVVEFAKLNPGEVSIAAGSKGQAFWISAMEFQSVIGAKFNIVPQEGAGGFSIAQVAGGHVDLAFVSLGEGKPQVDGGNARLLAVFGDKRVFSYPSAPTLSELGINCKTGSLAFLIAPPKMPAEITDVLGKAVEAVSRDPVYIKFIEERNNSISVFWPPAQTTMELDKIREIYRDVMGKAGILKEK
jgi:tripartite-type tricarboxylate transporter receptor subunit TctC